MSRRDKKRRSKMASADGKRAKLNVKDVTTGVKQLVATRIAEKYAENPERFADLIEVGLLDEASLLNLPHDLDFASAVKQFRDRLAVLAADEPSVLGRLELRPLDVFGESKAAPETSPKSRLSVVFSDLEGFTAFTSTKGDLEASAMLRDHYDTVDSIVRGRGGSVIKTIGDGHMLGFGESQAAVLAGAELAAVRDGPLKVRVGGHSGEVVKTPDDVFGHVVNVAARVADIASGGESLVTTTLRDAAGSLRDIEFDAPTVAELRGIDDPIEVCRVQHGRSI